MNKNILGVLSVLTVAISIIFFFIIRGPNANLTLGINVFIVLSVLGIIFAILSKKLWFIITGILLNGAVLVFVYFLLLAVGISEPKVCLNSTRIYNVYIIKPNNVPKKVWAHINKPQMLGFNVSWLFLWTLFIQVA